MCIYISQLLTLAWGCACVYARFSWCRYGALSGFTNFHVSVRDLTLNTNHFTKTRPDFELTGFTIDMTFLFLFFLTPSKVYCACFLSWVRQQEVLAVTELHHWGRFFQFTWANLLFKHWTVGFSQQTQQLRFLRVNNSVLLLTVLHKNLTDIGQTVG